MLFLLANIVEARDFSSWFDENGLLHHVNNPTTDSSENELLFTAEYLILGGPSKWYTKAMDIYDFYMDEVRFERHMSHDNKTGIVSVFEDEIRDSIFKVGHRWWFHPRDIAYYGYMKHGVTFPIMWGIVLGIMLSPLIYLEHYVWFVALLLVLNPIAIISSANIISCARTWKYYDDRPEPHHRQLTTSGKMLAFVRNKSAGLKLTHKICTWLIKRNEHFGSWTKVAKMYFPNEGHPIPILMEENENN